jgi:hypothetical protein
VRRLLLALLGFVVALGFGRGRTRGETQEVHYQPRSTSFQQNSVGFQGDYNCLEHFRWAYIREFAGWSLWCTAGGGGDRGGGDKSVATGAGGGSEVMHESVAEVRLLSSVVGLRKANGRGGPRA